MKQILLSHYKSLHDADIWDQSKINGKVSVQHVLAKSLFVIEIVHVAYTDYSRISVKRK